MSKEQLLPLGSRLGPVELNVSDGQKSLDFWTEAVGLTHLATEEDRLVLGAGGVPLVELYPGATGRVLPRRTGLYHLAIHVPTRKELARMIARLFSMKVGNSPTDHTATETTYLSDPDGNGIEITFETPERGHFGTDNNGDPIVIAADGTRRGVTEPLDLRSVLSELEENDDLLAPLPSGTRIGHVHLHVSDLEPAFNFYGNLIGFKPLMNSKKIGMADMSLDPKAAVHNIAFNTWNGGVAQPAPSGTPGLRRFTIETPTSSDVEKIANRLRNAGANLTELPRGFELHDFDRNLVRIRAQS